MGKQTGKPKGRPKGARNKRTEESLEAMKVASVRISELIENAFEGDAHALMIAVYKDPRHDIAMRLEASKAAIGYEKPKLSSIEAAGKLDLSLAVSRIEIVAASDDDTEA